MANSSNKGGRGGLIFNRLDSVDVGGGGRVSHVFLFDPVRERVWRKR